LRTHPLEVLLSVASVVLLTATIVVTVRVALNADTQTQDLTFGGTLDELALVLSNGGFDQLATLDHATLAQGPAGSTPAADAARPPTGGALAVDTIAILASTDDEPAAAPGGFI